MASSGRLSKPSFVPLRAADGAEQHGVGLLGAGDGGVADGTALAIDRGPADQALGEFEAGVTASGHPVDHPADLGHHLGADTVAGEKEEFLLAAF